MFRCGSLIAVFPPNLRFSDRCIPPTHLRFSDRCIPEMLPNPSRTETIISKCMLASGADRTVAARTEGFASICYHLRCRGRLTQRAGDVQQKSELQALGELHDPAVVDELSISGAFEGQDGSHVHFVGPVGPAESVGEVGAAHRGSVPHGCGGAQSH